MGTEETLSGSQGARRSRLISSLAAAAALITLLAALVQTILLNRRAVSVSVWNSV